MAVTTEEECKTPRCDGIRVEGRRFCEPCAENLDRIKREFEDDPNLLYNQRSDNALRIVTDPGGAKKKSPRRPTCCVLGCFELRQPPSPFCHEHRDEVEETI